MHCFENDESLEKTNRLIYDFSNDWMNKCRVQTQSEYNEYKKMLMLAFSNLLKHQTKHELGKLKEYCVKDICIFLKKEQIRGILQGWGRYMGQPCFYLLHTMREDLKNEYFEFVCENYFFTIPFQEDEFVEYINNEKKLLNFSIGVEFITKKNNIGLYIVENDE